MGRCMTGKTDFPQFWIIRAMRKSILLVALGAALPAPAQTADLDTKPTKPAKPPDPVSTVQFSDDVSKFLGQELSAHLADVRPAPGHDLFGLDPAPERVLGVPTSVAFSWGTFLRALASYLELFADRTLAGRDLPQVIGKAGLIEARRGGKAFAQMDPGLALRGVGADRNARALWRSLTRRGQEKW